MYCCSTCYLVLAVGTAKGLNTKRVILRHLWKECYYYRDLYKGWREQKINVICKGCDWIFYLLLPVLHVYIVCVNKAAILDQKKLPNTMYK